MAKQQQQQMQQQSRHQQTSLSIDQFPSPEQQCRPENWPQTQEHQQRQQQVPGACATTADGVIKKSSLKKKNAVATGSETTGTMSKQESKVSVNAGELQDNVASGGGGGKKEKRARRRRRQGTATAPDSQCLTTTGDGSSKASSVCGGGMGMGRSGRENSSSSLCGGGRDNPLLMRQSALRIGEDSVVDRCTNCGAVREEYAEDEVGLEGENAS